MSRTVVGQPAGRSRMFVAQMRRAVAAAGAEPAAEDSRPKQERRETNFDVKEEADAMHSRGQPSAFWVRARGASK